MSPEPSGEPEGAAQPDGTPGAPDAAADAPPKGLPDRGSQPVADPVTPTEKRLLRIQMATVLATLLPGFAALFALIFTFTSVNQTREELRIAEQGQITDRYTAAVTNLGADSIDQRIGGAFALQRIMKDSPRDRPSIVRILCAFVRVHAPARRPHNASSGKIAVIPPYPAADVSAALEVLRSRTIRRGDALGVELSNAAIRGAYLYGARLEGAFLNLADLRGADLNRVWLRFAYLREADLRGAYLRGARMEGVHLRGADLRGADLRGAHFYHAGFNATNLRGADIRGTDLRGTFTLTTEQVVSAVPDSKTLLPTDIAEDPRVRARIAEVEDRG
ncbi:pentapeptide repeat-containing protein [Streptomyces sp. NBC_01092]|uniref:pentapeptide repeat-containing protein n=1 Tax=Streptomyces sp. NBC_01092 TaxID=2903748 RepID=UPI003868EDB1|nr:pentapeptide repeat-containing protein [Streptomyces sp. NBC_01092]